MVGRKMYFSNIEERRRLLLSDNPVISLEFSYADIRSTQHPTNVPRFKRPRQEKVSSTMKTVRTTDRPAATDLLGRLFLSQNGPIIFSEGPN